MILLILTMNENCFRKSVINSFPKIVQYIRRLVTLREPVDKLLLQDCLFRTDLCTFFGKLSTSLIDRNKNPIWKNLTT